MPLYEYQCSQCQERFELLQRLGEGADGLECPKCGAKEVEKQFSTFAASAPGADSASIGAAPGCGSGFT